MAFEIVAGFIRNTGSGWILDNTNYKSINIDSITNTSAAITINYSTLAANNVGSLSIYPTAGWAGIIDVGASVGVSSSNVQIAKPNRKTINGLITWNGSIFTSSTGTIVPSYNNTTGELTLTHTTNPSTDNNPITWHLPSSTPLSTIIEFTELTSTTMKMKFYHLNGTQKTPASPEMYRFYIERRTGEITNNIQNPNNIISATEGFFVLGFMEKL